MEIEARNDRTEDLTYRLPKPYPATCHTQWHADDKPDQDQGEHGAKWHGTTRALGPDKQVEEEEGAKNDSGK
jgi:hypothetical protein